MAKILVIDDERAIRNTLKEILEFEGHSVEVAENGRLGLDKALSYPFDLIFTDIKMPGMDGMQTMKALKKLEGYQIPKIVVLTANAAAGAREMYLNEGFDYYLSKPIDIHELNYIIKKNIKK